MTGTDTPSPPSPRRRRAWRIAAITLAALVLLCLGALYTAWRVLGSDAGTAWLLSQVKGLKVVDGRGTLNGGPYQAARVEFDLKGSPLKVTIDGLSWHTLQWRWRPYAGAWAGLDIDGLQAQRVQVRTIDKGGKTPQPPASLRLPIEVRLTNVQLQSLQVDALPAFEDVHTELHLGADAGRTHRIGRLSFGFARLKMLQAAGAIDTDAPLKLQADGELESAGATGTLPWHARLAAVGPLARIAVDASLRTEGHGASLELQTAITPFAQWPFADLQAQMQGLDLASFSATAPSTRLEGHARFRSTGLNEPV
ncbi:MAG TPA: hypothetical protein VFP68_04525, partial [Burkholderiaceae bacterium]|nr:hypothetical protein [Burkholderiaceae bacterium]